MTSEPVSQEGTRPWCYWRLIAESNNLGRDSVLRTFLSLLWARTLLGSFGRYSWARFAHGQLTSRKETTGKQGITGQGGKSRASPTGFLSATVSPRCSCGWAQRQGDLVLGSEKGPGAWRQGRQGQPYIQRTALGPSPLWSLRRMSDMIPHVAL